MAKIGEIILGILVFISLIGAAFDVGIFFGIIFILGVIHSLYTGLMLEKPGIPVAIFSGGLIIRVAITNLTIFKSETPLDLIVSIFTFILIYFIGVKVKEGNL